MTGSRPWMVPLRLIVSYSVALSVLLTACGGGNAPAKSPSIGHTLAIASSQAIQIADPDRFDIPFGHTTWGDTLTATLVRYKVPAPGKLPGPGDVVGDLAKSWTVAPDGVTFVLRTTKSQYGNPLTAADVKYSLERGAAMHDSAVDSYQQKAGINQKNPATVIDDHTVKVNAQVNTITLPTMAFFMTDSILDSVEVLKHVTSSDPLAKTWLQDHSATFGPYELGNFNPAVEEDLVPNPGWWGGTPYFTKVAIRTVPDASSRLLLLTSGQVDFTSGLTAQELASLKGLPGLVAPEVATGTDLMLHLDLFKNPALRDTRVRQAISLAIDRKGLIQGPFDGRGLVPVGYWSQALPQQKPLAPSFPFDTTMAKSLLAQAGYSSGMTLIAEYSAGAATMDGGDIPSIWVLLQQQLQAVGVTVQIKVGNPSAVTDERNHVPDMFIIDPGAFVFDPGYISNQLYTKDGFNNVYYVGWFTGNEPKANDLAIQSLTMPVGPARDALLAQLNQTLRDDNAPFIPLIDGVASAAKNSAICGDYPAFGGTLLPRDLRAC